MPTETALDRLSHAATRDRWQWVHRAISSAKKTNAKELESAEARQERSQSRTAATSD